MTGRRDCVCPRARHRHGTRGAYSRDNCRCLPCAIAYSRAHATGDWASDPDSWVNRIGTIRRVQALAHLGWPAAEVARRLGVSGAAVSDLMLAPADRPMLATTAARIAAVYDELSMSLPTGRPSTIAATRTAARRNGWAPPLAWDDIDDPDATPQHRVRGGHLAAEHAEERGEIVAALTRANKSAAEIADFLGVAERTVTRDRARGRAA